MWTKGWGPNSACKCVLFGHKILIKQFLNYLSLIKNWEISHKRVDLQLHLKSWMIWPCWEWVLLVGNNDLELSSIGPFSSSIWTLLFPIECLALWTSISAVYYHPWSVWVVQFRSPGFICLVYRDAGNQDKLTWLEAGVKQLLGSGQQHWCCHLTVWPLLSPQRLDPSSLPSLLPSFLPDTLIKQLCCARRKDQSTQGPLQATQNLVGKVTPWWRGVRSVVISVLWVGCEIWQIKI